MTNKDFFRKALSKLHLGGQDLPAALRPDEGGDEKNHMRELALLNAELKNKDLLIIELRSALEKREAERGRAELELTGRTSDLKALIAAERDEHRASFEQLELRFSSAEKALLKEVEELRAAVTGKDTEIDKLSLDLKTARGGQKGGAEEAEALAAKVRRLEAALKDASLSQDEKGRRLADALKALERVKAEADANFEKLSARNAELAALKNSLESANAGVETLKTDLAGKEREFNRKEKARLDEPSALKDVIARRELENAGLRKELQEALKKAAALKEELEDRKKELDEVGVFNRSAHSALKEKDEELRSLENRLQSARKEMDSADAKLAGMEDLKKGSEQLAAEIKKLEQTRNRDAAALKRELDAKDLTIADLQNKLEAMRTELESGEHMAAKTDELRAAMNRTRAECAAELELFEKEAEGREKALQAELQTRKEAAARKEAEAENLRAELAALKAGYEDSRKELKAAAGRIVELEKARDTADNTAAGTQKLKELHANELSALRAENEKAAEEYERLEQELARKSAEFTAAVSKERQEHRARCGELEQEFSSREKALLNELQTLKEGAARRDAELESLRAGYEAARQDLKSSAAMAIELEKARAGADKAAAEAQKLKELHAVELSALRSELEEKELRLASFNAESGKAREEHKRLELELNRKSAELTAAVNQEREEHRARCEKMEQEFSVREKNLLDQLQAAEAGLARKDSEVREARNWAEKAAAEARKLKEFHDRDVSSFQAELDHRDQKLAAFSEKTGKAREAYERLELELNRKSAEFTAAVNKEREEHRAQCAKLEQDFSSREKALLDELQALKESSGQKGTELERLRAELEGVRAGYDAAKKELKDSVSRLTEERDQRLAAFSAESEKAREEYKRAEQELTRKNTELTAAANKGREERMAYCEQLEKAFSSRERTLLEELEALKETSALKDGELDKLGRELKSVRELYAAAKKDLEAGAAELGKLENLQAGILRLSGEMKKLEEARARENRASTMELATREHIIASLKEELAALQAEHARAKRELAGKNAELKSALDKESRDLKAALDKLEKESAARENTLGAEQQVLRETFLAREKTLNAELQALKEAASRREAEFDKQRTELETLKSRRETDKRIVESYAAMSTELEKVRSDAERKGAELARLNMDLKNVRERHDEDAKRQQFYSAKLRELDALKAEMERRAIEHTRLAVELNTLRETHESAKKEFATYPARLGELEKFKTEAARLAAEIKNLEQARAHDERTLELELKNKAQATSALQAELFKHQEAHERAENELAARKAEFKSALDAERAEHKKHLDGLRNEGSAKEAAALAELEKARDEAGRAQKELQRQTQELKNARERYEAGEQERASLLERIFKLEKFKDGAEKYSGDIKKLKDGQKQELDARDQAIALLNDELARRQKEFDRLELELAGRNSEFKEQLAKEHSDERAERDKLEQELAARTRELETIRGGARSAANEMKRMDEAHAQAVREMETELEKKEKDISGLKAELAGLRERQKRAEAEAEAKSAEIKALREKDREDLRANYAGQEKELKSREVSLTAELRALKEALARRDADIDRLGRELQAAAARAGDTKKTEEALRQAKNMEVELAARERTISGMQSELLRLREEAELAAGKDAGKSALKELEAARARIKELEAMKTDEASSPRSEEEKRPAEGRKSDVKAMKTELKDQELIISSLQSKLLARRKEYERLERDLADKALEFKALVQTERAEYAAARERLEREYKAREKALTEELRNLKKLAGDIRKDEGRGKKDQGGKG